MPSKKVPCIDCGKLVRSKRCVSCFRKTRKIAPENRFWDKVNKDGPIMSHMTTPCWVWTGSKNKQGYGNFEINSQSTKAHRFSYLLYYGELPFDRDICHSCDNPSCVNPEHLFAGTTKDNILDMEEKGRSYHPKGSNHGLTHLNENDVLKIRELRKEKNTTYKELAIMYKVGQTTIARIIKREYWKHI